MAAKRSSPAEPGPEYLTTSQAATLLGVSEWTVRQLDETGQLPAHHRTIGEHRRYRRSDVVKLLDRLKR